MYIYIHNIYIYIYICTHIYIFCIYIYMYICICREPGTPSMIWSPPPAPKTSHLQSFGRHGLPIVRHLGGTASHLYVIFSIWEPQPRHWALSSCIFLPKTCFGSAYSISHTWSTSHCMQIIYSKRTYAYLYMSPDSGSLAPPQWYGPPSSRSREHGTQDTGPYIHACMHACMQHTNIPTYHHHRPQGEDHGGGRGGG